MLNHLSLLQLPMVILVKSYAASCLSIAATLELSPECFRYLVIPSFAKEFLSKPVESMIIVLLFLRICLTSVASR